MLPFIQSTETSRHLRICFVKNPFLLFTRHISVKSRKNVDPSVVDELRQRAEENRTKAAELLSTDPYNVVIRKTVSQMLWAAEDFARQARLLEMPGSHRRQPTSEAS